MFPILDNLVQLTTRNDDGKKASGVNFQFVEPHLINSSTRESTGSTRVAWPISLWVIGKQFTRRSLNLKTALTPPAVDGSGRRDNASATAFCLEGTNLMP